MKILFINIPVGLERGGNFKPNFTKPPIAYLWLAAILEQHGIAADIYDAFAVGANEDAILHYIEKTRPDMIGFTVFTTGVYDVIHLSRKIKARFSGCYVVVGGYHTSISVEELIGQPFIDFACIGEGEFTLVELVGALERGGDLSAIAGLVYKEDGRVVTNTGRMLRTDMDAVPTLAYKKIVHNNYIPWWSIEAGKTQKFISTVTGKGCPMNCIWCEVAKTEGLKYRCMSAPRVMEELLYLKHELGITHLSFDDANFTIYRSRVEEICEGIIRNNLGIKWSCSSTILNADDIELLRLMKRAGCEAIYYGVESGHEAILQKVKKVTKQKVRHVVKTTKEAGISPHCSFILGLPGDTKRTMQETIDFAIELEPASASFSIAIPYKGTVLYEEYESKGYIKIRDWRKYGNNAVFETEEFSAEYLEELIIRAHRQFYWRPKYIMRRLLSIRSFRELMVNAAVGVDLLRRKLSYKN